MRVLAVILVLLIAALQYPMWLGKGGWLQVRELDRQLGVQREANVKLKGRNDRLDADVRDLKTGYEAIEERARSELGMVRQDEVFFQLQNAAPAGTPAGLPNKSDPGKGNQSSGEPSPPLSTAAGPVRH